MILDFGYATSITNDITKYHQKSEDKIDNKQSSFFHITSFC